MESSGFDSFWKQLYNPSKRSPLDSLKLSQTLLVDDFLALLNTPQTNRSAMTLPREGSLIFKRFSENSKSVSEWLRLFVDEWLETGRDENGVENPSERTLEKAGGLGNRVWEYSKLGKISLLHDARGLTPWITKYPDERPGELRSLSAPSNEKYATEQLVFFLLSDIRYKLARCRKTECGRYFVLKHWNRQYKGGTRCKACRRSRSLESALKATTESRESAASKLHQLAAKRFAKRIAREPQWYKNATLKAALADYLNTKIERSDLLSSVYLSGGRKGLTGKWVARADNWKAIEALLKGDV